MSYDDNNGSWDSDAKYDRDFERESPPRSYTRAELDAKFRPLIAEAFAEPKLNPTGSVRAASMPKCTVDHEAMKLDDAIWSSLKHIGNMPSYDEPGKPDILELRNCTCGSTLARPYFARTTQALQILRDAELL